MRRTEGGGLIAEAEAAARAALARDGALAHEETARACDGDNNQQLDQYVISPLLAMYIMSNAATSNSYFSSFQ
jgi:hypothetical protein